MAIVRARMALVSERNMEHNFRAGQHGAVILYYADCLRELYTKVARLQRTKSARTPGSTPELRTVLGFPRRTRQKASAPRYEPGVDSSSAKPSQGTTMI
jgi:hypothetical protein